LFSGARMSDFCVVEEKKRFIANPRGAGS
jgi:hypothetical protein